MGWAGRRSLAMLGVVVLTAGLASTITRPAFAAAATGTSLQSKASVETVRGPARTFGLPDGGFVAAFALGQVVRQTAGGQVLWSRDSAGLYRDWQVRWHSPGVQELPQQSWGSDPVNPLVLSGYGYGSTANVHPDAVGDLTGDGVPDVVVADTVGVSVTALTSCFQCQFPFTVPGSNLHLGTFVSVLDGRTGRTLYTHLEPGYVTQVAVVGSRLLVGDETGDPQRNGGIGQWGSVTTVHQISLVHAGAGFVGIPDWSYSTRTPWARLFGVVDAGHGDIALAWSDTPPGLGVPGPPDGHLVLVDAGSGRVRWDRRTAGYPVLLAADRARDDLVAVQLIDPTQRVGYTFSAIRRGTGTTIVTSSRAGALPLSLAAGAGDGWVVGSVDATVDPGQLHASAIAGRVSLVDAATGGERWSVRLPGASGAPALPAGLVVTGGTVFAGSWLNSSAPSATAPYTQHDNLVALSARTGALRWGLSGDPGDPMSMSPAPDSTVRAITGNQQVRSYAAAGATGRSVAEQGDILATVVLPADTRGAAVVAGDQSGAVYGYAGATPTARARWQATLPGPVRDLQATALGGVPIVVAAATSAIGVIDARDGRVRDVISVPGAFLWSVTLGTVGGQPAAIVPTGPTLDAYSLRTGARLWRFTAPDGASFSNAGVDSGVVVAEYSSAASQEKPAARMAATGLDANTGRPLWTVASDPASTARGQLWHGVVASPDIPAAAGHGVALAWQTTGGSGRIDVRDARTGALDYSDTADDLDGHTGYLTDPSAGLLAVSLYGTAQITASGALPSDQATGMGAAIVRTAATGPVLLSADGGEINAFPMTFDNPDVLATDLVFAQSLTGLGADGQVLGTPGDRVGYQIVSGEVGVHVSTQYETLRHAITVVAVTSATGQRAPVARQAAPAIGIQPSVGDVEPPRGGTTTPQVKALAKSAAATPYQPALMRSYLGLTGDGSGQTIAIVDAYADPSVVADAEAFSEQYGLPGVCGAGGAAGDCFTLGLAGGSPTSDPDWALETSLDVEWTHALAPRAHILLVQAADATLAAQFHAVDIAAAAHPDAISLSWGVRFEFSDEAYYDGHCAAVGATCVAASGDAGHPGLYPAYNPAVLAVGGTTLTLNSDGTVGAEQAWSGSGGGRSWVEPAPAAQLGVVPSTSREIPDVSFDADPETGVAVYDSQDYNGQSGWWQVGGTSLGAPAWSAILADADQLRVVAGKAPLTGAAAQRAVYAVRGRLADITSGPANGFCPVGCAPAPGFDDVTGLGSPRSGIDSALAGATS